MVENSKVKYVMPQRPSNPEFYFPPVKVLRSGLEPAGNILIYRITKADIQEFISKKANHYAPGAKATVIAEYCEKQIPKKKQKGRGFNPNSYATLIIGLSTETLEKGSGDSHFAKLVEKYSDVQFVPGIWNEMVKRYRYNRQDLIDISKDYAEKDQLKTSFGMSPEYLDSIIKWSIPIVHESANGSRWAMFAARPQPIIRDMLTEVEIWKLRDDVRDDSLSDIIIPDPGPKGRMSIEGVTQIDKDNVEYLVYLHLNEIEMSDNPELRDLIKSFN